MRIQGTSCQDIDHYVKPSLLAPTASPDQLLADHIVQSRLVLFVAVPRNRSRLTICAICEAAGI